MSFRRSAAVGFAFALALLPACKRSLEQTPRAQNVPVSVFDPATQQIPLPNDLALQSIPDAAVAAGCGAALPDAKSQFLCSLKASGGFPNDQEVPISVGFLAQSVSDNGAVAGNPAALDTTTIHVFPGAGASSTVAVWDVTNAPTIVPVTVEASYSAATGTLTLRVPAAADGSRRWTAGHRYAAFVRGGASGVLATGGVAVEPMPTMFVLREAIISNSDLTLPQNQGLLPGTAEEKAAAAAQLEPIRRGYATLVPVYEASFGAGSFETMANMLTFTIAPAQGVVIEVDATKGSAPLPIDLLRAPDGVTPGLILPNPAYGAAEAGLVTLDGFSATAPMTAPLTGFPAAIDAATVGTASGNVLVYDLSTTPPTLLKEFNHELQTGGPAAAQQAAYIAQPPGTFTLPGSLTAAGPCPPTTGGCASSLELQPAVPIVAAATFLPPLKGATKYGVVVTKRVKDVLGRPLARSTVARISLALTAPVDTSRGIDAGTAALLEQMRTDLAPVFAPGVLPAGTTKSDVAMAYVFRTQTVTGGEPAGTHQGSLQLSAFPYGGAQAAASAIFVPQAVATTDFSAVGAVTPNVASFFHVTFPSVDVTSKANGALDPIAIASPASHLAPLRALVAVPSATNANLVACPAPASALKCAPLVVFGHGLQGRKEDVLGRTLGGVPGPLVDALVARGFIVAALDFPQHGERTWCFQGSDCDKTTSPPNTGDGTCTPFPQSLPPTFQGDTVPGSVPPIFIPPGTCTNGSVPSPSKSGQTFVSANFFRTRDTFRQDMLDQAALVLALARPPAGAPPTGWPFQPTSDPLKTALALSGLAVDPGHVFWAGISLGGISGTEVLATNPRFSRAVNSVPGGTLVDVFTHAPAFHSGVVQLFSGLLAPELGGKPFDFAYVDPTNAGSFDPVVAKAYGQTILTAKWILDPGDPLNYAQHLVTSPLTGPLGPRPAPPDVLQQIAIGDQVVPNDWNHELAGISGAIDVVEYTSLAYPANIMHGILSFDPKVQGHAADYLLNLTKPPAPPTQVTIP